MARNVDGEVEVLLGNKQLLSIFFVVVILLGVFFTMGYLLGRNSASGSTVASVVRTQPQSQPPAVETAPLAPVQETVSPVAPTGPVAGETYLQVIASSRAEVDLVVSVLKKKGFRALTAPGPSEGVFRALVGPLVDATAISDTRAGLEKAGFKPILRKY